MSNEVCCCDELIRIVHEFCKGQEWASKPWKDQPHVKPLFEFDRSGYWKNNCTEPDRASCPLDPLVGLRIKWIARAHERITVAQGHAAVFGRNNETYHRFMATAAALQDCARDLEIEQANDQDQAQPPTATADRKGDNQ